MLRKHKNDVGLWGRDVLLHLTALLEMLACILLCAAAFGG
jgi:hypothetical protein